MELVLTYVTHSSNSGTKRVAGCIERKKTGLCPQGAHNLVKQRGLETELGH